MTDPYKILGVSSRDSDEKIKEVYKELVRKYHPDNHPDDPLSEVANEKMSQINNAFDEIMNARRGGFNSTSYNSNDNQSNRSYGANYSDIRRSIQNGNISQAENDLESVNFDSRDAEWYFLKASIYYKRGWLNEAYSNFERASEMDPSNNEYNAAFNQMKSAKNGYMNGNPNQPYRTSNTGGGCGGSGCDMCTSLICADCCCECMGGDLIACC